MIFGMRVSSVSQVESDLAALRNCAERAGAAFACLFSTSEEFEAEIIRVRIEQQTPVRRGLRRALGQTLALSLLTFAFLML